MSFMINLHKADVAESGNNTNGSYIKLSDGAMIAWHKSTHSVSVSIAAGSWYRSGGGAITWTYPIGFLDIPNVSLSLFGSSTFDVIVGDLLSGLTTSTQASPILLSSVSQTVSTTIHWLAVGRWK